MKYRFMSNPCGHYHCMEWECEKCRHFKPYFHKIRVSLLKNLIKETCAEIIIDFNAPPPVEYISDEDLKIALTGIEAIKEFLCNY